MGTASVTMLRAPVSRVPRLLRSTVGRNVRIRPLKFADLDILMPTVGVLVDSLYPRGAEKLLARLEDALNGYAVAHVAEVSDFGPVALASETLKGDSRVKLSTFWVHRRFRGLGIGGIAGIKRNPRPVLRFEFGVVAVGRVWFRLDSGCRSPV